MKTFSLKCLILIIVLAQAAVFAQTNELENLFQTRQYFDLRDAAAKRKGDGSPELLFYRGVVANRFNELEKSVALLRKYISKADKNAPHRADAYEILADNLTKEFEYAKAADAYKFLLDNFRATLAAEKIEDFKNVRGLWSALAGTPRQTVALNGDSTVQGTRDIAKLLNIPVEIGGGKMDFVFDTGANLSTMSVSTARKLGLKLIEADVSVGSSTDIKVKSKLAVAPVLKIGSATVYNAVFLVLDDNALYFPKAKYQIHGIIGFPVMQSLGRLSIARDDRLTISANPAKSDAAPNMCLDGLMPLVAGFYQNRRFIFAFDTGAVSTDFYYPFFKTYEAEITKDLTPQKTNVGGAAGMKEAPSYKLKNVKLTIGGKVASLSEIDVLIERTNEDSKYIYGNLGQDLIKQFERMTLDFRAMQLSFE
jgi:hypothetical protein